MMFFAAAASSAEPRVTSENWSIASITGSYRRTLLFPKLRLYTPAAMALSVPTPMAPASKARNESRQWVGHRFGPGARKDKGNHPK